jgi:hypothetical protein
MRRIVLPLLRFNYVLLVPWIILSIPTAALFQQQLLLIAILTPVGLAAMLTGTPAAATSVSASLLGLIIWGKVASDLYGLAGPDSALFLLQFMMVILLMEASNTELTLDVAYKRLEGSNDEISKEARTRMFEWAKTQLFSLGKLTSAAFLLSLGLIVLGGLVSVSINQFAFSGALVLIAVVALLILLTYRREPEERKAGR